MIKRYAILTAMSLTTGILTHMTFYPLLEQWHNERMRSFAKFGIGVCVGLLVFLGWFRENQRVFIGERVGQWYEAQNGVKYFISECGNFCLSLWQNFPRAFVCRYTA